MLNLQREVVWIPNILRCNLSQVLKMKPSDTLRKSMYVLLGVLPSLSLLPLPFIFVQSHIGLLFFISLAGIGGCIGLCLAIFYPPSPKNKHISSLIAFLLVAGSAVAGTMFFGFFLGIIRQPFAVNNFLVLLLFGSPVVVAAHYLKSLIAGLLSKGDFS